MLVLISCGAGFKSDNSRLDPKTSLADSQRASVFTCDLIQYKSRRLVEVAERSSNMATTVDKICNEALYLPAEARISLIERLLKSLNLPTQADIDHLWAEEAERRITEIDRGDIKLIPGEQVFDTIRQKYGQ